MNLRDLVIIYLACGAPFAVYYHFQNKRTEDRGTLWLKTMFAFVFWIVPAYRLVARKSLFTNLYRKGFADATGSDSVRDEKIAALRKYFEVRGDGVSVFEMREIFDRYVGLTDELVYAADDKSAESELLGISKHPSKATGEACLERRTRLRLDFHRRRAARDFANAAKGMLGNVESRAATIAKIAELAGLLGDEELRRLIPSIGAPHELGTTEVWKPENLQLRSEIVAKNSKLSVATLSSTGRD